MLYDLSLNRGLILSYQNKNLYNLYLCKIVTIDDYSFFIFPV